MTDGKMKMITTSTQRDNKIWLEKKRKKGKKKREVGVYSRLKWARRHIQLEPNKKDRERERKQRPLVNKNTEQETKNQNQKQKHVSSPNKSNALQTRTTTIISLRTPTWTRHLNKRFLFQNSRSFYIYIHTCIAQTPKKNQNNQSYLSSSFHFHQLSFLSKIFIKFFNFVFFTTYKYKRPTKL